MRAISNKQFIDTRFKSVEFEGKWLDSFGRPALCGNWIIYGKPYSGKTGFTLQLAKYLTSFDRVAYDSLEQGNSKSLQMSWERTGMIEAGNRILLLDKVRYTELRQWLKKRKSPNVIIIDSVQYMLGFKLSDLVALNDEFRNKLFIWVSHEKNHDPDGQVAQKIKYDADVKIWVEGYKAFVESRFAERSDPFTIWEEGANNYWLDKK